MKIFYFLVLVLMIGFFGLIVWMNATPGYFQQVNICDFPVYVEDSKRPTRVSGFCQPTLKVTYVSKMLVALSGIDFYR